MTIQTPVTFDTQGSGPHAENVEIPFVTNVAPSSTGTSSMPIGKRWINMSANAGYEKTSQTTVSGVTTSTWSPTSGPSSAIATLTGDTGGAISPSSGNITLAGGTGIATVGSGSTITFNTKGGGFEYSVVTADTQMAVNVGYIANKAGTICTLTLPATAAVGDAISVLGLGATLWLIAQNAGQTVRINGQSTTTGATGSLSAIDQYNTAELVCVVANTDWVVKSGMGILTVT